MGKSSSAPKPPDPKVTAGAQTAQNIGTATAQQAMNNVNQVTPWGSLNYSQNGTYAYTDPNTGNVYNIPQYTATQTLSPMGQQADGANQQTQLNLANLGNTASGNLMQLFGSNLTPDGLPQVGNMPGAPQYGEATGAGWDVTRSYGTDFSEDRQRVEDALMSRLNPQLERDTESLRGSLINQGLTEGTEAFDRAMNRAGEQSNDARMQAVLAGGQEQSRLAGLESQRAMFENAAQQQAFGQNMSMTSQNNATRAAGFGDLMGLRGQQVNDRQRAMQEQFAYRSQPINEIMSLMGGGQVQTPNFITPNTAQMANVDVAGLTMSNYNQQMQAWQQQQAQRQSLFGGVLGLGAGALSGGVF